MLRHPFSHFLDLIYKYRSFTIFKSVTKFKKIVFDIIYGLIKFFKLMHFIYIKKNINKLLIETKRNKGLN